MVAPQQNDNTVLSGTENGGLNTQSTSETVGLTSYDSVQTNNTATDTTLINDSVSPNQIEPTETNIKPIPGFIGLRRGLTTQSTGIKTDDTILKYATTITDVPQYNGLKHITQSEFDKYFKSKTTSTTTVKSVFTLARYKYTSLIDVNGNTLLLNRLSKTELAVIGTLKLPEVVVTPPIDNSDKNISVEPEIQQEEIEVPQTEIETEGVELNYDFIKKTELHFFSSGTYDSTAIKSGINLNNNGEIEISPEADIRTAGYNNGNYNIVYNFLNEIGGFRIKNISNDRTELQIEGLSSSDETINAIKRLGYYWNIDYTANFGTESNPDFDDALKPLFINLGKNNLLQLLDVKFIGDKSSNSKAELEYPRGINTVFVPTEDINTNIIDGAFYTFAEVDLTIDTNTGKPKTWFDDKNYKGYYRLTGVFRQYKLFRNSENKLEWVSGGRKFTSANSIPNCARDIAQAVEENITFETNPNNPYDVKVFINDINNLKLTYQYNSNEFVNSTSAVIKLDGKLPVDIFEKSKILIDWKVYESYEDFLVLFNTLHSNDIPFFSDPNFDINIEHNKSAKGEFQTWTTLLDSNTSTTTQLINKFFSGSFGEIELNIDYSDFANFINFSSATERVDNFVYKLQEIERYNDRITTLQSVSGSDAITNISQSIYRRDALIGSFDEFENWLYYDNDGTLYTHHSSSNFVIEPTPKSSTNPNVLYRTTNTQFQNWYESTYTSAELFDSQNQARLSKFIPETISEDPLNAEYTLFVDMVAQHFDISWNYIKAITDINKREENPKDGVSDNLLPMIAESLGFKLYNGHPNDSLSSYMLGVQSDGTLLSSGSLQTKPYKKITNEIWRRLVNTLPYIYKTKGTERSLRAVIAAYGIPNSFLKVREYGGPRAVNTPNKHSYERVVNKLHVSSTNYITNPWDVINGDRPSSIEIVGKFPQDDFHILTMTGSSGQIDCYWDYDSATGARIRLVSDTTAISSSYVPYNNRRDISFILTSGSGDFSNGVNIYASWVDDWGNLLSNPTASTNTLSSEFESVWNEVGSVIIGGSTTTSTASIQEVRYYRDVLSNEISQFHAANREAYFADDNTTDLDIDTAYDKLSYRIQPDSTYTSNTSSIVSLHPNQKFSTTDSGLVLSASLTNFGTDDLITEVDTQWVTIPSMGGLNLNNDKVRIESATLQNNILLKDKSNSISEFDYSPLDSNKLGLFFSSVDTVNYDIFNSEGYFDIDDLIGDNDPRFRDGYDELDYRSRNYFQKYTGRTAIQLLFDLVNRYDMSVFDTIKQLVPARAKMDTGVLIEPHIFERNSIDTSKLKYAGYSRHDYDTTIQQRGSGTIGGEYHNYNAVIEQSASGIISAENNTQHSSSIDMNLSSTYKFYESRLSSSGEYFTDTNPYWEYNALGTTVLNARSSQYYLEPVYFYNHRLAAEMGVPSSASYVAAQVQDTRLTLAMENLLYNGCKVVSNTLTSDSIDTPDGGPAIEISAVDPNKLTISQKPGIINTHIGSHIPVIGIHQIYSVVNHTLLNHIRSTGIGAIKSHTAHVFTPSVITPVSTTTAVISTKTTYYSNHSNHSNHNHSNHNYTNTLSVNVPTSEQIYGSSMQDKINYTKQLMGYHTSANVVLNNHNHSNQNHSNHNHINTLSYNVPVVAPIQTVVKPVVTVTNSYIKPKLSVSTILYPAPHLAVNHNSMVTINPFTGIPVGGNHNIQNHNTRYIGF